MIYIFTEDEGHFDIFLILWFYSCRIDYDLGDAKTDEPVASNYYPINTWISTTNNNDGKSVTILTDRSSGASSITNDSIEVFFLKKAKIESFNDFFSGNDSQKTAGRWRIWRRSTPERDWIWRKRSGSQGHPLFIIWSKCGGPTCQNTSVGQVHICQSNSHFEQVFPVPFFFFVNISILAEWYD